MCDPQLVLQLFGKFDFKSFSLPQIEVNMGGVEEEEEGRDGQTHYVVEQFVAEVRTARFKTESNKIRLV